MKKPARILLFLSGIAFLVLLCGLFMHIHWLSKIAACFAIVSLAIGLGAVTSLKSYQYTVWIIAAVVCGMIFPQAFTQWGSVNLRDKTLILVIVQLVMFGMGTSMSLRDFKGIATTGKGVVIGLLCQFSIMPLMGFLLTRLFHFEPEIAAGIILIGSCSSGLASNVMVYLAKANLVLSVILTSVATLAAPILTPLLMKLLAGTLISIHFVDMMLEIIKIVLVPVGAALLHDFLRHTTSIKRKRIQIVAAVAAIWIVVLLLFILPGVSDHRIHDSLVLSGFMAGSIVAGVLYNLLSKALPVVNNIMPLISMFGIIYFTAVTTAAGRDNLLQVGLLLFLASVIHNAAGYFLGYWLSRLLFRMEKDDCETIALEVGLQNGGLASGIAGSMGKLGTVGLASAVFSPWMNISGSLLANYWRRRKQIAADNLDDVLLK